MKILFAFVIFLSFPAVALAQSPPITVTITTPDAAPGLYFVTPGFNGLLIMNNFGEIVYFNPVRSADFKRQGDYLTYFNYDSDRFEAVDKDYLLVNNWQAVNSQNDPHELILEDNGHALFITYRSHTPYDLSPYGGYVTATVVSCVLQELDVAKNLVWEWEGLNYNPVGDTSSDLTRDTVDYDHCNAIEVDTDGNLMVSHRNLNQITKINRATGDVIWKLGGASNEFTFTNDPGFALQHDIRRLPDGRISLFDDGTVARDYSRAVEYEIDESGKVVTRTWEFLGPFTRCCGSARLQPNGNMLIGWGLGHPTVQEVNRDGTIVFEADLAGGSYRAIKADWYLRYHMPLAAKN